MPKDATPDEIVLVNENFANPNHEEIATEILEKEWDAQTTFQELGEKYEPHRATIQDVYNRYFGVGESQFNDGIHDERTIKQLKEEYGKLKNYIDKRERGELDMEPGESVTEREMELIQEGYRKGYQDGLMDGMEQSDN